MAATSQVNIRIPIHLREDLELISKLLNVNLAEWVKTKLAEKVYQEKTVIIREITSLYTNGAMTKKEIRELVGNEVLRRIEVLYTRKG